MSFHIAHGVIDTDRLREAVRDPASGACVVFEGWVRNHHEGQAVLRLEYEVYEPLALREASHILEEAVARFGPLKAAGAHRAGLLEIGELAVAVAVSTAHRDEAFAAARFLIDQYKSRLPIWKKEFFADGRVAWVNCKRCSAAASHG